MSRAWRRPSGDHLLHPCTQLQVTPNDVVRGMVATGANVLPNSIVQDAFKVREGGMGSLGFVFWGGGGEGVWCFSSCRLQQVFKMMHELP
jgi:hypothetical protein